MTASVHHLSSPEEDAPPLDRRGLTWGLFDYEGIVAGARAGWDLDEIAESIGRNARNLAHQIRHMLPHEQRAARGDVALQLLAEHLEENPDYDWRAELAKPEPPRPIVVERRQGFAGFGREDLVPLLHAVLSAGDSVPVALREKAISISTTLDLWDRLQDFRRDHLYRLNGMHQSYTTAIEDSWEWVKFHRGNDLDTHHPWSEYNSYPF
ncbi:MAG: hypothetical protein Q4G64_10410 [bacterium]|nr:hypothetical protein [bacterium]